MATTPAPPLQRKIGALYSWLIRQPHEFILGIKSVTDAEKLYDVIAGQSGEHDAATRSERALAAIGYDPVENSLMETTAISATLPRRQRVPSPA